MLNLITITSIEASRLEAKNNLYDDVRKSELINPDLNSIFYDQKTENIQFISNNPKSENSNGFFIKSDGKAHFHTFQRVGEWINYNGKQHIVNQLICDTQEYVYCPRDNKIYNKFITRSSYQKLQSPIIKMVVDDKAKPEILVNNSEIHEFNLECIDRAGFIPFFTLIKLGQELYVSSIILFFKYYKKIHCSRLQIKFRLTLEETKEMIQHSRQDFIEAFVSDIQVATPEYAVQQVLKIFENEDYVTDLLNLKDAVDFEENEETKVLYARNKNRLPFVHVNQINNYNKNFWRRVIPETCKNIDISNYLYSVNDKMMTINGLNFGKVEKVVPLKWRIRSNDIVCAFEILNPQRGEYFYDKFICKRVFTTSPFFLNRKNRFEKMDYVFFFSEGIEKKIFCVKFVDGMLQTIREVDILKILHILETTNVFYFLTHNMT